MLTTTVKKGTTQADIESSGGALFHIAPTTSQGGNPNFRFFRFKGREFDCGAAQHWKTTEDGMARLGRADRLHVIGNGIRYVRRLDDFPITPITN